MGSNKNGQVSKTCKFCGNEYFVKFCRQNGSTYCSKVCQAAHYTKRYSGENNPNFRNIGSTSDGYPVIYKVGRIAIHKHVALEVLNISSIPKGYHIHHRDCIIHNNNKENLALLSASNHKWLHKQFGNATLWAFCKNKVSLTELCEWSNNPELAEQLLTASLENQIGTFN